MHATAELTIRSNIIFGFKNNTIRSNILGYRDKCVYVGCIIGNQCDKFLRFETTVEPLIAATFTAKVRWPLLGGGRYSEVYYKYGKVFGTEG